MLRILAGVARITIENFTAVAINKIIRVQFANLESIPLQSVLDEVADNYFATIGDGVDFLDASIRALYLNLPFAVNVIVSPAGDIAVNENEVAVMGVSFSVIGEVYEQ